MPERTVREDKRDTNLPRPQEAEDAREKPLRRPYTAPTRTPDAHHEPEEVVQDTSLDENSRNETGPTSADVDSPRTEGK